MIRKSIPLTLGFTLALALAGCGPTASEPVPDGPVGGGASSPAEKTPYLGETLPQGTPPIREGGSAVTPGYPEGGPIPEKNDADFAEKKADMPAEKKADMPAEKKDGEPAETEAPKTADVTLSEDEVAAVKELGDPADVDAALAQKICAVGEEDGKPNHLGTMGKPIKVDVAGKTAFVCCKGCVDELKANPEKYLAKIGK